MHYQPPGWAAGVLVTRAAFLLWMALCIVTGAFRARARHAPRRTDAGATGSP
jgi:hypothetical protein